VVFVFFVLFLRHFKPFFVEGLGNFTLLLGNNLKVSCMKYFLFGLMFWMLVTI
jgi:hypothetical protein